MQCDVQNAQLLRQLLLATGEASPYVLVGHGLGGQLALQYAALYPSDVAGLAMLDRWGGGAVMRRA
jgi:pimeloyl-ACP methyl ester carboxylesterase